MARGQVIRAVLDANVLYSAFLRDVLLRLAAGELFYPHWTERIHDEWIRNLAADRADLPRDNLVRTAAKMDGFFSGALVRDYEALESRLGGVHPGDRHVAAAALKAGAGMIVRRTCGTFPQRPFNRMA